MLNIYSLTSDELDERWDIYRIIQGVNLPIDVKEQEIYQCIEAIGIELRDVNEDLLNEKMKIELNSKEIRFRNLIYDYLYDIREEIDTEEYITSSAEYVKDTYDLSLLNLEEKWKIVFNLQKGDYITLTKSLINIITPGKFDFYGNTMKNSINAKFKKRNHVCFPIITDDGSVYTSYKRYESGTRGNVENYSTSMPKIYEEKKKINGLICEG